MRREPEQNIFCKTKKNRRKSSEQDQQPSLVHQACMLRPPLNTIKMLVSIDRDSLTVCNKNGWFPLQVACYYRASIEVIRYLLDENPRIVKHVDELGKTALHLLLHDLNVSPEVIQMIVSAYPSAALIEDSNGMSALEQALMDKSIDSNCINIINKTIKQAKEEEGIHMILSDLIPTDEKSIVSYLC